MVSSFGGYSGVLYYLEYLGLTDVILPFVLIFAVVWAILQKAKIFDDRKVNLIIALAIALGVVIPHATGRFPPQADPINIINTAIPQVAAVIIAVLMLFIIVGMWGAEADYGKSVHAFVVLLAVIIVVWIFGRAANWWTATPRLFSWLGSPQNQALVVIILIFGLIVWFITGDDKKSPGTDMLKGVTELFKRPKA